MFFQQNVVHSQGQQGHGFSKHWVERFDLKFLVSEWIFWNVSLKLLAALQAIETNFIWSVHECFVLPPALMTILIKLNANGSTSCAKVQRQPVGCSIYDSVFDISMHCLSKNVKVFQNTRNERKLPTTCNRKVFAAVFFRFTIVWVSRQVHPISHLISRNAYKWRGFLIFSFNEFVFSANFPLVWLKPESLKCVTRQAVTRGRIVPSEFRTQIILISGQYIEIAISLWQLLGSSILIDNDIVNSLVWAIKEEVEVNTLELWLTSDKWRCHQFSTSWSLVSYLNREISAYCWCFGDNSWIST